MDPVVGFASFNIDEVDIAMNIKHTYLSLSLSNTKFRGGCKYSHSPITGE